MRIADAIVIVAVSLTSPLISAEAASRVAVDASVTSQRFCLGADPEIETAFLQVAFKIRNTGAQPVVVCTACLRVLSVTFLKDSGLSESQVSRQELDVFVLEEGVLKDSAFAVVKQQDQVLIPHEVVAAIAKGGAAVSGFPGDGTYVVVIEFSVMPTDAMMWAAKFTDRGELLQSQLEARFRWSIPQSRESRICNPW